MEIEGNKKSSRLRELLDGRHQLAYCLFLSFFAIGMALASLGPVFLELARQTNSTIGETGYLFPGRSVGYLLGSSVGGPLFDKYNGNRILSGGLFLASAGTALIPVVKHIWLEAIVTAAQGIAMGVLDTGGNVMLIRLFHKNVPNSLSPPLSLPLIFSLLSRSFFFFFHRLDHICNACTFSLGWERLCLH
jgi:MFS family permease